MDDLTNYNRGREAHQTREAENDFFKASSEARSLFGKVTSNIISKQEGNLKTLKALVEDTEPQLLGLPLSYWQNRPQRSKPGITTDIEVDSEDEDWNIN